MLVVEGLNQPLRARPHPARRRICCRVRRVRAGPARPQRGRQEHDAEIHHRPSAPQQRAASPSPGRRSRGTSRIASPGSALATCRRSGRIFTDLSVLGKPGGRTAKAARSGPDALDAGAALRPVPQSRHHARPARRSHERWGAADAHHRPHLDGQPAHGSAGRAQRGAGPRHRRADGGRDPGAEAEGVGVVLAEQNLHFARRVADTAVVLESGRGGVVRQHGRARGRQAGSRTIPRSVGARATSAPPLRLQRWRLGSVPHGEGVWPEHRRARDTRSNRLGHGDLWQDAQDCSRIGPMASSRAAPSMPWAGVPPAAVRQAGWTSRHPAGGR